MTNQQLVPTKGNLMALKKSNTLAKMGYDLMDRKRIILIHEMMQIIKNVRKLRDELSTAYHQAYLALQEANITLGVVGEIAKAIPIDEGVQITYRSVMGVDIPKVIYQSHEARISYGIGSTNTKFDYAFTRFLKVRDLTILLAETENSAYRLANAIRKSQKQANALKTIVIPEFEFNIKSISDALEERDREEFSRKKVIKNNLQKIEKE
ncbi:MAG: V-type ATP synthase subunit D [Candidatus Izemoplasmatales bacterium]|jgi:V/A-type H+-transporting ATPase subunit D|nr:V-type ATP synthase subunit D [Candidatus Izemoplasmatales bacterium]MDD4595703.1 V-type ATP synthase subunit D [Candidatus Izemoplasmatales bacterium]